MNWNYNTDELPRGHTVVDIVTNAKGKEIEKESFVPEYIAALVDGETRPFLTRWIPRSDDGHDGDRWEFLGKKQAPMAFVNLPSIEVTQDRVERELGYTPKGLE